MGALLSTSGSSRSEADQSWVTFPPKSGAPLFAGHFYLGGDKFESVSRDSYIFGEAAGDLHYVNSRPVPFGLAVGKPVSVSRPLRALVNVRKETLRFVKADVPGAFHVEFVLDALAECEASIWLFARHAFAGQRLALEPQHPLHLIPERRRFGPGCGQVFSCTELTLRPALFESEERPAEEADEQRRDAPFPVAVLCETLDGHGPVNQQLLLCAAERQAGDATYSLKLLKQIMVIDGLPLVAHDIYGVTDRGAPAPAAATAAVDSDPNDSDCVVCMVNARDTLILPCRHLCLCDTCADSLRYQASCCPICRAPFRALLQLSVLRAAGEAADGDVRPVPILEFLDDATNLATHPAGAAAPPQPPALPPRRPPTAQAWASPVKKPMPPDGTRDSARRNPYYRALNNAALHVVSPDDPAVVDDSEDCWADSESSSSDDEKVPAVAGAAAVAEAAPGPVAFPMAVLPVDGDADRGSASTESANSQQQLLPACSAPVADGAACAAEPPAPGGGLDTEAEDDSESDFGRPSEVLCSEHAGRES